MKILHIITRIDRGGSAENTLLTVRRVTKHKSTLVTGSVKHVDVSDIQPVIIKELVREIQPYTDLRCLFKLYRFIRKESFDIVHVHSSKAGLLGRIAAKFAGVPHIIYTPHGHVFYGYFGPFKTRLFIFLERLVSCFTEKIIALTDNEAREEIAFGLGDEKKFVTIPSGVDIQAFAHSSKPKKITRAALRIPSDAPVVISVARLEPIKGHTYLLDAMPHVRKGVAETHLLLVGDGEERQNLEIQAGRLGILDYTHFLGEREDVPNLLAAADVFVICSLNEGMGRSIVEAMAAGLPIVASDVCGIPDLVEDGYNGRLVPPRSSKLIANALLDILQHPEKAQYMGHNARQKAPLFSIEKMIEKLNELYDNL